MKMVAVTFANGFHFGNMALRIWLSEANSISYKVSLADDGPQQTLRTADFPDLMSDLNMVWLYEDTILPYEGLPVFLSLNPLADDQGSLGVC